MLAHLLLPLAHAAGLAPGCQPDPVAEANAAVEAMERAILAVDDASFDAASGRLTRAIGCLGEVPAASDVFSLHRGMALAAFVNGQITASKRSLAAVRRIDPTWEISGVLFSPTHPYRELYASARDTGETTPLPRDSGQLWVIDGLRAASMPTERAFLLQELRGDEVVSTRYVWDAAEVQESHPPGRPPYRLSISADGSGAFIRSRQQGVGSLPLPAAVEDRRAPAVGLNVRWTPGRVAGIEASFAFVDPHPSGQAALLLGYAWEVAPPAQPHAGARIGWRVETFRTLLETPPNVNAPETSTLSSLLGGVELGLRAPGYRVLATAELPAVRARYPSGVAFGLSGGAKLAGPLAVEAVGGYRATWSQATDGTGNFVGGRTDSTWQLGVRVGLWLN